MKNDEFICRYCGRVCKNKNSLTQHEIRCKQNHNAIKCYGNKGNMPKNTNVYLKRNYVATNGDVLDVTNEYILNYHKTQLICEICGRTLDESVKWKSKYAAKHLCVDHDHNTLRFRGLLCSVCNRQLGWYEKNSENIKKYLEKHK